MNRRILIACLFGAALFAAGNASAGALPGAMRIAASAAVSDGLYNAVLKASVTNLPPGVSQARTAPAAMDDNDRRSGVVGILEVTFQSSDPSAKFNYVFLANAGQANAYAQHINAMVHASGASPIFLPFAPNADCAANANTAHMICAASVDRVIVVSFATQMEGRNNNARGPVSLAGPLIKAALDHLANVKKTSGRT